MKQIGILVILFILTNHTLAKEMDDIKLKNRTATTLFVAVGPLFPMVLPVFQGYGQLYNGQHLKTVGFFVNGFAGGSLFLNSVLSPPSNDVVALTGLVMFVDGYV